MKSVNIEVYAETDESEQDVFAVVSEHRPELPKPFDEQLQQWARANFSDVEPGTSIPEAGELHYEPFGEIAEIRTAR